MVRTVGNLCVPARGIEYFLDLRCSESNMLAEARTRDLPSLNALLNPSLRHVQQVSQFVLIEETLVVVAWTSGGPSNLLRHDRKAIASRLDGLAWPRLDLA